ncbi:MAG: tetratricopeptide repeat protein, partial [Microcystis aeruginosa L311-01]|nr:tetratricopeptide repeat protein [Microcystis aeruginosa L311-01]
YLQALDLRKRLLGDNHPHVADSLSNLAGLYDFQGRYTEAEPLYLQALDLRKRLLGDNHPDVALSLSNLAGLYDFQGRYTEAEPLYLQALDLRKRLLGENHPDTKNCRNNLQIMRLQQKFTSLTWLRWIIVIPIVILWMPFYLLWMLTRWLVRRFIR